MAWSADKTPRQELATAQQRSFVPSRTRWQSLEEAKSPNRFVTATMRGVRTSVAGSPLCSELLHAVRYSKFALEALLEVDRGSTCRLILRIAYVSARQEEMWRRHAPDALGDAYQAFIQKLWSNLGDGPSH